MHDHQPRDHESAEQAREDLVFVDFPPELEAPAGTCGLLKRRMYGTRRAAEGGQDEYSPGLRDMGFLKGSASACVFRHEE